MDIGFSASSAFPAHLDNYAHIPFKRQYKTAQRKRFSFEHNKSLMQGAHVELAQGWNAYRRASLPSWACFAGDSLRMKHKRFDLEQNHSLYHHLI